MATHLPEHARHRVGGKRRAVVWIETVERLDEAEASDLDEVVERFAAIHEPARDVTRDP